jgi:hypothetical protein
MAGLVTGANRASGNRNDERWQRNTEASQRRLALKEQAIAFLGGRCRICGYDKCPAALDFHHPNRTAKDFVISSKASWWTIEPELRKCELLCATCHREVHAGWHPGFLIDEDDDRGGDLNED